MTRKVRVNSHETQMFPGSKRTISLSCQRILKREWHRYCAGSSIRQRNHILGARSKLDEFFLKPHFRVHFGPVPEKSRNYNGLNPESKEDRPPPWVNSLKILPRTRHPTWLPDFWKKIHTAPLWRLQTNKKVRSTIQLQFRSKVTSATIEADHFFGPPTISEQQQLC